MSTLKKHFLVVEDDLTMINIINHIFHEDKYIMSSVSTLDGAIDILNNEDIDIIILDKNLENNDCGLDLLKYVRRTKHLSNVGIIIVTSSNSKKNISEAYELQADEYLVKPFSKENFKQRALAVLRRTSPFIDEKIYIDKNCHFNTTQRYIEINDYKIRLSKTDHKIMMLFCQKRGQILSREDIINAVWSKKNALKVSARTVDVHISRLRNTLREKNALIATIPGSGYKMLNELLDKNIIKGRPKKLPINKIHLAEAMLKETHLTKQQIADCLGVSLSTLYNALKI